MGTVTAIRATTTVSFARGLVEDAVRTQSAFERRERRESNTPEERDDEDGLIEEQPDKDQGHLHALQIAQLIGRRPIQLRLAHLRSPSRIGRPRRAHRARRKVVTKRERKQSGPLCPLLAFIIKSETRGTHQSDEEELGQGMRHLGPQRPDANGSCARRERSSDSSARGQAHHRSTRAVRTGQE